MKLKLGLLACLLLAGLALVTGCETEADVTSANLSMDADEFKINRRIVFFNGITDTYLLSIEGRASIFDDGNQLEVTVKTGEDAYKKHFLGLSDNVSYFVEQLESADVDKYRYKVLFRPQVIIPDVDLKTGSDR